jgi:glycosyltransferase involved in cell wall biosynthesis
VDLLDWIFAAHAGLLIIGWLVFAWLQAAAVARVRNLREALDGPADAGSEELPSLTVVVTACDEAGAIEQTVRRLMAQRYPRLEVVIVDDRSTDGTGEILDRLAASVTRPSPVLRVIHVRDLPAGWIGKCHACSVGAAQGTGDWILFTDGDVSLIPDDLLARIMRLVGRERLDHVALFPDMGPMDLAHYALVTVFGQLFLTAARAWEMDRDRPRGGGGVGAFNLVRRSAYDRVGGHGLLKMDAADDFKLGVLLKESGCRQRFFDGGGLVMCPWHRGALGVAGGLEKNAFSAFDYSLARLVAFSAAAGWMAIGPIVSLIVAGGRLSVGDADAAEFAGIAPILVQMGILLAGYTLYAGRHGRARPAAALVHPLAVLLLIGAIWNSAVRTLARGGIRWRGTFYPLEELRRGLVPRGAGRRLSAAARGHQGSGGVSL